MGLWLGNVGNFQVEHQWLLKASESADIRMPFQTNLVFETDETVKVVEFQTIDDNLIEGTKPVISHFTINHCLPTLVMTASVLPLIAS